MQQSLKYMWCKQDDQNLNPQNYSIVWQPTYNSSLKRQRRDPWSQRVTDLLYPRFWVWVRDTTSKQEWGRQLLRKTPDVRLRASHSCAHMCTHRLVGVHVHMHIYHIHIHEKREDCQRHLFLTFPLHRLSAQLYWPGSFYKGKEGGKFHSEVKAILSSLSEHATWEIAFHLPMP